MTPTSLDCLGTCGPRSSTALPPNHVVSNGLRVLPDSASLVTHHRRQRMQAGDSTAVPEDLGKADVALLDRCSDLPPERDWRHSEQDLWVQLAKNRWQRTKLVDHLQAVLEALTDQAQLLQRRERVLSLGRSRCELLAAEQRPMECSPDSPEQERHLIQKSWEAKARRRPEQDLEDKILLLQIEVEKTQRCLDQLSRHPLGAESSPRSPGAVQGQEPSAAGSKMYLLPDLGQVPRGTVESSALTPHTAFLQEQLLVLTQVNERFSEELDQSQQRLESCLEQLQQLRGEQTLLEGRVQALESERMRPPGENPIQVQEDPGALGQGLAEEQVLPPKLQEKMAAFWKARWHQTAVALKFKERELQRLQRPGEDPDTAAEKPGHVQEGPWPQQLAELRSREEPEEQPGCAPLGSERAQTPPPQETPLPEVGAELAQMRAALQKVWDVLKARDLEMQTQQWALEQGCSQIPATALTPQHRESQEDWQPGAGPKPGEQDSMEILGDQRASPQPRGAAPETRKAARPTVCPQHPAQ